MLFEISNTVDEVNTNTYRYIKYKKNTVLMSHGVAAGSIGLEGDGPTTLRLQINKSLEYVEINIKKELSCIVTCIELFNRKITFEISMLCYWYILPIFT